MAKVQEEVKMIFFHKLVFGAVVLACTLGLSAIEARAESNTVSVFDDKGAAYRVLEEPGRYVVERHNGNIWIYVRESPRVSADDKRDALSYVQQQLRIIDQGCAAFDALIGYQEDLLSGELELSAAKEMASLWREHQRAERRVSVSQHFAAAFK